MVLSSGILYLLGLSQSTPDAAWPEAMSNSPIASRSAFVRSIRSAMERHRSAPVVRGQKGSHY